MDAIELELRACVPTEAERWLERLDVRCFSDTDISGTLKKGGKFGILMRDAWYILFHTEVG